MTTTVHSSILRWEKRGFWKSDGTPVLHKDFLDELIHVLEFPSNVAVVKCVVSINDQDLISRWNVFADAAAKQAASAMLQN